VIGRLAAVLATTPAAPKENSFIHAIGTIFHPIFLLMGWILAGIYSVIPNYAVAIIGLTIVIMLALTPVTVKSTKSMIAMQRLQPEMKKLQAKFKGPENREQLNAEMMKLYKENGTSPFGACLPSLLQMPFLIILYSLIRGLGYTVKNAAGKVVAAPRYIPVSSKMHQDLVASGGQMHSWFGMDLSSTPFTHHGTSQAILTIPYLVLIGFAIFLQYYQMKQMNSRNPQAAQANPQMQAMQKFFPIIFGVIYLRVPAGATIYMVVSSAMRIGTQELMFRTGMVTPVSATTEREIGPAKSATPEISPKPQGNGTGKPTGRQPTKGSMSRGGAGGASGRNGTNGRKPTAGNKPSTNGRNGKADQGGEVEPEPVPKEHPRSRSKRTRKAR
jgi:YidC/Oxa1 family membrane protein insertase